MKNKAFTLAEVLIVVAVIGLVATLTIPNLMHNYRKKVYAVKIKNFYNDMRTAIVQSELKYGPMQVWNFGTDDDAIAEKTMVEKYFLPNLKYSKKEVVSDNHVVTLRTGETIIFDRKGCLNIYFDVNGDKKPNKWGSDKFLFLACQNTDAEVWFGAGVTADFGPYGKTLATREDALEACAKWNGDGEVSGDNGYYCSSLLMFDDWKFKDDYPHKI